MATHSSIPAWKIPRTEEPGGLQSMGSQRVRHDKSDLRSTHTQVLCTKGSTKCIGNSIRLTKDLSLCSSMVNSVSLGLRFPHF